MVTATLLLSGAAAAVKEGGLGDCRGEREVSRKEIATDAVDDGVEPEEDEPATSDAPPLIAITRTVDELGPGRLLDAAVDAVPTMLLLVVAVAVEGGAAGASNGELWMGTKTALGGGV